MRLSPVIKPSLFVFAFLLLLPLSAQAQSSGQSSGQPLQPMTSQQLADALQKLQQQQAEGGGAFPGGNPDQPIPTPYATQGGNIFNPFAPQEDPGQTQAEREQRLKDPNSAESKAQKLAREYDRQAALEKGASVAQKIDDTMTAPPPMDMMQLQDVRKTLGSTGDEIIDPVEEASKISIDIRRDAQKAAALSFGARGGLAKRNFMIMERMAGYEATLDGVFNFRALLVRAPSGLLVEPPIVSEALDALIITPKGDEAAVADQVLDINKQAKIVSAPRDWRQYLLQVWTSDLPPPPRILWPKNKEEQASWDEWVAQGWRAGTAQADEMFEVNLNRLVADYNGMVRYRMLLAQGKISQPYVLHEDRGVTGTKTVMRVGDRALRITGPSQFLTGSELWKPADR